MAFTKKALAAAGSSGNTTHTGVEADPSLFAQIGCQFVVETASGGTQDISWQVQGSFDDVTYFAIPYILTTTATEATAARALGAGVAADTKQVQWLSSAPSRFFRYYRVVTTLYVATLTYRCELYLMSGD